MPATTSSNSDIAAVLTSKLRPHHAVEILDTELTLESLSNVVGQADNGPHQGAERTNIRWSTMQLRQCKASIFEGGIRVRIY
jgi:hypothetical protein